MARKVAELHPMNLEIVIDLTTRSEVSRVLTFGYRSDTTPIVDESGLVHMFANLDVQYTTANLSQKKSLNRRDGFLLKRPGQPKGIDKEENVFLRFLDVFGQSIYRMAADWLNKESS